MCVGTKLAFTCGCTVPTYVRECTRYDERPSFCADQFFPKLSMKERCNACVTPYEAEKRRIQDRKDALPDQVDEVLKAVNTILRGIGNEEFYTKATLFMDGMEAFFEAQGNKYSGKKGKGIKAPGVKKVQDAGNELEREGAGDDNDLPSLTSTPEEQSQPGADPRLLAMELEKGILGGFALPAPPAPSAPPADDADKEAEVDEALAEMEKIKQMATQTQEMAAKTAGKLSDHKKKLSNSSNKLPGNEKENQPPAQPGMDPVEPAVTDPKIPAGNTGGNNKKGRHGRK